LADQATYSEHDDVESGAEAACLPATLALVVIWCRDEPWRIGQSLTIPSGGRGSAVVFGRGKTDANATPPKLALEEWRPGHRRATQALSNRSISREQLAIRAIGPDRLHVRNVGRCPLLRNEVAISEGELAAGDVVQLGRQLMFVVVARPPLKLEASAAAYPEFPFGEADPFGIVGESAAAWRLRHDIAAIARRRGHVLVLGETGTGKELVARAIHGLSGRGPRPLVTRNAATLPESLIDAELFGNQKNYPNAGMPERPGLVGEADGSSLFLDEIAELPRAAQSHLLRLLDGGEYTRLGEARPRRSDVRLIAATNRDVTAALKHDLLARFTFRITVCPLDARAEDVPLLVRHIVRRSAGDGDAAARVLLGGVTGDGAEPAMPPEAARDLARHRYPGNVRELEAFLWQRLAAGPDGMGSAPAARSAAETPRRSAAPQAGRRNDALTPELIQRCLNEHNGSVQATSKALGLGSRFALLRLIKRHNLEVRRRPGRGPALHS
jgi:two-component system nitrogen regulation response regulator GlnG/two-component system response regulator HydG